ncbi:hypothetical protein SBRY_120130 [Actinacidiphila bryophytorum]|uniref:Uncharacterized protein n=1 Tax=Actinacidiphila bryophytorum TaxID=1436133 RepID=A0A9W4ECY6_9ACTN|nr:hypothetical protein SBRY_120130 [Actinacidiphila bryophytorum]
MAPHSVPKQDKPANTKCPVSGAPPGSAGTAPAPRPPRDFGAAPLTCAGSGPAAPAADAPPGP